MSLLELKSQVEQKTAKIAIIGLGYVGLPVACQFADVGYDVLGVEIQADRVERINAGLSPIEGDEPGLADLLNRVVGQRRVCATSDYMRLKDRDIVLIDVETPVDEDHIPRYKALSSVIKALGPVMKSGVLVIVESTISPGTMQDLVAPLLEESSGKKLNIDFFLGNCPERVMPGKLLSNLKNLSRVVGGMTPETSETMVALYKHVVQADLDSTDCVTAELVKTVENAYRDVQIAFANEVALICEAVGGDVWKVRELVNKTPFRQMHLPGAGVGGHCIPKDPWLLAYGVREKNVKTRLISAARVINDSMPLHIVDLLVETLGFHGKRLSEASILIMGYSYLEDSDDTRNSPSETLVNRLTSEGAEVLIHDPYVPNYDSDLFEKLRGRDAAVVMVKHQSYLKLNLAQIGAAMRLPILIDGRKVFEEQEAINAGFTYRSIGIGIP
jgi:UDP-N-acetyl-D-mannosaminuronic acid dehydrogenase